MIKVGDRVKVVEDVWDDHREESWLNWEGLVISTDDPRSGIYPIYVQFPKAEGLYKTYDFKEEELEVLV